ncbi:MAG: PilZ domain-containing protein [Myxococcota bacterium]|nr:PilZ domain-containing protein [Myxococcota bacterium]
MQSQRTTQIENHAVPQTWTRRAHALHSEPAPAPAPAPESARAERREQVVRSLEYSHYPRNSRNQQRLTGLTRDQSHSGLCVIVDQPEAKGTLLQVVLQTLDGESALEALALIVWCRARDDGRYAVGLSLVESSTRRHSPMRVVSRNDSESPARLCA